MSLSFGNWTLLDRIRKGESLWVPAWSPIADCVTNGKLNERGIAALGSPRPPFPASKSSVDWSLCQRFDLCVGESR